MRRNQDLIREMLLEMEAEDGWVFIETLDGEGDQTEERAYHRRLMSDGGLIDMSSIKHGYRMTSAGHDYLDAIRDEGLWAKTKATVAETGGNATLQIFINSASGFLRKKISDQTGINL